MTQPADWKMFQCDSKCQLSPHRETNSGLKGVWVYEIGTSPYFTNVAPGEVPILPTEAPTEGVHEDLEEEATEERSVVYPEEQQVEYPPYESGGDQIEVHPVQYHRNQPGDPEVVVVDDTDLNVDGEFTGGRVKLCVSSTPLVFTGFFHVFSVFLQPWDMYEQQK